MKKYFSKNNVAMGIREVMLYLLYMYLFGFEGRAYLGSYPELVQALQKTLTSDERDPITRENALGTLQKLSLK